MWARKVFCEACGTQIDELISPTKESNGMGEAMVLGDSRRMHREETGCPGDHRGWQFGPWRKVREKKKAQLKVQCVAQHSPNCDACQCSKPHSASKCKSKDWSWHTCLIGGTVKCLPENHPERTEYEETKAKVLAERSKDLRPRRGPPEDGQLGCPC